MKKVGIFLMRGLIVVVALAVVAAGGGAYYFKSYLPNTVAPKSFPKIDGEIQLEGLDGAVDIYRDHMGIPHIYAATSARSLLRTRLCPRTGPFLANGFLSPRWRRSGRLKCLARAQVDNRQFPDNTWLARDHCKGI